MEMDYDDGTSGRGPELKPMIKAVIANVYFQNQQMPIKKVMEKVHKELQARGWQARPGWPGISIIQKETAKIRKKQKEAADPEEKPWNLLELSKVDIPPEALPDVMRIWAQALKDKDRLTIRQARWIGRLYYVFKDVVDKDQLVRQAYAMSAMDKVVNYLKYFDNDPKDAWWYWRQDAYIYELMTGDAEITKLVAKQIGD